jgi:2-amino-4-hydroxy-6-hydroxymethyldihydropteridine diphosphokinase
MAGEYGAPEVLLEKALLALGENEITVLARSRQWQSRAWPDPDAPDYRNAVCLVETKLTPASLMATLHRIERAFGRVRDVANAPRTLDLDLIAHGRVVQFGEPVLPHPRGPPLRHGAAGGIAAGLVSSADGRNRRCSGRDGRRGTGGYPDCSGLALQSIAARAHSAG